MIRLIRNSQFAISYIYVRSMLDTLKHTQCFFSFSLFFFSARRFGRAIRKRPNTVRCLAVKKALLGTRHPRNDNFSSSFFFIKNVPNCLPGGAIAGRSLDRKHVRLTSLTRTRNPLARENLAGLLNHRFCKDRHMKVLTNCQRLF